MNFLIILLSMVLALISATDSYAAQKTVKLTTYYPAPYGEYKRLNSTEDAHLATTSGSVGIGTATPQGKLDVSHDGTNHALVVSDDGHVGIGTTTPNGVLDISSTASGFLPPRMTTNQRDSIDTASATSGNQVPEGMVIYNATLHQIEVNRSTTLNAPDWVSAVGGGGGGGLSVYTGFDTGNTTKCPGNSGSFTGNWVCSQFGKTCVTADVNVSHECTSNLDCSYYGGPANTGNTAIIYCR